MWYSYQLIGIWDYKHKNAHTHIYINNLVFFYLTLRDPTGKKHLGSWRWLWLARLPSSSLRPPHTHIIGTTMSLLTLNLTLRKSCLVRQIYKLMMFYLICDLIEIWIFLFFSFSYLLFFSSFSFFSLFSLFFFSICFSLLIFFFSLCVSF